MKPIDLCVPIYLNQKIVFDVLAMLEDGFSQLSTLKTSASESETQKSGLGTSIGASNIFALLGVSFKAERGKEGGTQGQEEVTTEKVHTPASLFSKFRLALYDQSLIESIDAIEEVEGLASGQFVEFRAILRKNPLVEYVDVFKQLVDLASLFPEQQNEVSQSGNSQSSNPSGGSKKKKRTQGNQQSKVENQPETENQIFIQQLDGLRAALTQSDSLEIIGEMLDSPTAKAVLSTNLEYFSDRNASEIIDGEFRVLGKVVRVVNSDSEDSINLLRKTGFGPLSSAMFDELGDNFSELEEQGVELPEFITEIEGPAVQVIPVAIFT